MYRPLPESVTIGQSLIEGLGLFATQEIPVNTNLGMTHIYDERFPDSYIRLPLGGFFNHSSEPNCKVVHEDFPYRHIDLITIKDIKIGEELTAYYTLYVPEESLKAPEYELRGYGIMPYNCKEIQAGIQYSHAIVEYVVENYNTKAFKLFLEWAKKFKTAVLLDGGTSCHSKTHYSDEEYIGTMEKHLQALTENDIIFSTFYEPDMNNMLSGIFLIADERVFNKKKYPDYGYYYDEKTKSFEPMMNGYRYTGEYEHYLTPLYDVFGNPNENFYSIWVDSIGGKKNLFLRNYLSKLPLWR